MMYQRNKHAMWKKETAATLTNVLWPKTKVCLTLIRLPKLAAVPFLRICLVGIRQGSASDLETLHLSDHILP